MADEVIRDMPPRVPVSPVVRTGDRFFAQANWGAIWAGVMVTMGLEALFLAFGIFIDGAFGHSDIWSFIWYLVTMAVSFYAGARVTGRLSEASSRDIAMLNGLATWGLATLGTVLIAGIVLWNTLQLGTTILTSNVGLAPRGTVGTTNINYGAIMGQVEFWGGMIWGGIMLSLITAFIGGRVTPSQPALAETETAPRRRVG